MKAASRKARGLQMPLFRLVPFTRNLPRRIVAVAALLSLWLAMLPAYLHAGERTVTDAFDRKVSIATAERIVTLGPDVTEIAFALGVGERIVGLDRGSKYPAETSSKPNVGYRRALSAEGLLALRPDLILAAEDIGPPEVVDILKSLSIAVVFVPEDNSLEGMRRKITLIAATLDREPEGQKLSQSVSADFEAAARLAERVPERARKKVLFFHGLIRLTAAGDGTAADAIIGYAGGINPFTGVRGYKAVSEEVLLDMAPDTILMMSNANGGPTPEEVFAVPALRTTPAAVNRSLVVLDGPYMLGFGPRTAGAIRDLAHALYPEFLAGQ
jgi:iron complex transport system substrate-binding protein